LSFMYIYFQYIHIVQNIDFFFPKLKSQLNLCVKFNFTVKSLSNINKNFLNVYTMLEYSMLNNTFSKFNNIFFLRASIGANWGFLDNALLLEEQEKNEKDRFYNKSDDIKQFFYFLNSKDQRFYDDTTNIIDIKDKR